MQERLAEILVQNAVFHFLEVTRVETYGVNVSGWRFMFSTARKAPCKVNKHRLTVSFFFLPPPSVHGFLI